MKLSVAFLAMVVGSAELATSASNSCAAGETVQTTSSHLTYCQDEGMLDAQTPERCQELCTALGKGFSTGSWSHSPGCFSPMSGQWVAGCHWNNNEGAIRGNGGGDEGANRALCDCDGSSLAINPYAPAILTVDAYSSRDACAKRFNDCGVSCATGTYTEGPRTGEKYLEIHHNTAFSSLNPQAPTPHLQHPTLQGHKCWVDPDASCGCQCTCLALGEKPHCVGPLCPQDEDGVGASIKIPMDFPLVQIFELEQQVQLQEAVATLFGVGVDDVWVLVLPTTAVPPAASADDYKIMNTGTCEESGYNTILDIADCEIAGQVLNIEDYYVHGDNWGADGHPFRFDQPAGGYSTRNSGRTKGCTVHNGKYVQGMQHFPTARGECGTANFHCVCKVRSNVRRLVDSSGTLRLEVYIRVPDLESKDVAVGIIGNPLFAQEIVEECSSVGLEMDVPVIGEPTTTEELN